MVEVIIVIMWFLISFPKSVVNEPSLFRLQLICENFNHFSYVLGIAYPLALLAVCTYYAIITRKIPEAFNESKYIGLTVYTTCVVWVSFFPIYFMSSDNLDIRTITLSVTCMVSASVVLACLFAPKLYMVLCKKETTLQKNNGGKLRFKTKLEAVETRNQTNCTPVAPSKSPTPIPQSCCCNCTTGQCSSDNSKLNQSAV